MAAFLRIVCPTRSPSVLADIPITPGAATATVTVAVDLAGIGEHEIYAEVRGDPNTTVKWQGLSMQVVVGQVLQAPGCSSANAVIGPSSP
jgi:hypothetical protein